MRIIALVPRPGWTPHLIRLTDRATVRTAAAGHEQRAASWHRCSWGPTLSFLPSPSPAPDLHERNMQFKERPDYTGLQKMFRDLLRPRSQKALNMRASLCVCVCVCVQ